MNLLTVSQWIKNRTLADQTSIVRQITKTINGQVSAGISNNSSLKVFNNFKAWTNDPEIIFETDVGINTFIKVEKEKFDKSKLNFEGFINSHIDNGNFKLDESKFYFLERLSKKFEVCRNELSKKNDKIFFFDTYIKWYLLDNEKFAQLLIDCELPVLTFESSYWWGYFSSQTSFFKQEKFMNCFGNMKINPLDNFSIIINELRIFLEREGIIQNEKTSKQTKEPNLPEKIKDFMNIHKETKHEIEIRRDLSSFNDNSI